MQTNLAFQIDDQDETFQTALIRLGECWPLGETSAFSTSFVTQIPSVYSNLLSSWPEEVGPEESLALLSRDIAGQMLPMAERYGINTFGLSLSSTTDAAQSDLPFLLLYDLERGIRVPFSDAEALFSPERALWVGYAPLDEAEAERFLALQKQREAEPPSEKILENLQAWQRSFSHTLALAQADAAMSMEAQTSLLGLLKQGRSLQGAVMLAQSKTSSSHKGKIDVKTETQKMRTAIVKQLANGALPEAVRAALRLSLKQLDKAAGEKPLAWKPKTIAINVHTKTGQVKSVAYSNGIQKLSTLRLFRRAAQGTTINPGRLTFGRVLPSQRHMLARKKDTIKTALKATPQKGPTTQGKTLTTNFFSLLQKPLLKGVSFLKSAAPVVAVLPLIKHVRLETDSQIRPVMQIERPNHTQIASLANTDQPTSRKGAAQSAASFVEITKTQAEAATNLVSQPVLSRSNAIETNPAHPSALSKLDQIKPSTVPPVPPRPDQAKHTSASESAPLPVASAKTNRVQAPTAQKKDKVKSTPASSSMPPKPDQAGPNPVLESAPSRVDPINTDSMHPTMGQKPEMASGTMPRPTPDPVVTPQPQQTEFKQEPVTPTPPKETITHDFSQVDFQSMGVDLGGFSLPQLHAKPTIQTVSETDLKVASDLQDKTSKAFEAKLSATKEQNTQNEKKGAKDSPHRCSDPFCVCHMAAPAPK